MTTEEQIASVEEYVLNWQRHTHDHHQDEVFRTVLNSKRGGIFTNLNIIMTGVLLIKEEHYRMSLARGRVELLDAIFHELNRRIKGYVYLIHAPGFDAYKIGRSSNPFKRSEVLQIQLPTPIEIAHLMPAEDPFAAEKYLHEMFKPERLNGEWFRLSEDNIYEIKQMDEHFFRDPGLRSDDPLEDRRMWEWIIAHGRGEV